MSVIITCDECKHDIRDGDEVICYSCYESLDNELKEAREGVEAIESELKDAYKEIDRLEGLLKEGKRE